MKRTHQTVAVIGLVLALASTSWAGLSFGGSVAVGALVASVNLYVLSRSVHKLVDGASPSWAVVAGLKFIVLLGVTYVLIDSGIIKPLALAVGFGALPLGILLAGLLGATPQTAVAAKTDHA